MSDEQKGVDTDLRPRYVAGLSQRDGQTVYSVWLVVEVGGDKQARVGQPIVVIDGMTKEGAEHLHMQLGNALGRDYDGLAKQVSDAADTIEQYGYYDGEHHKDWVLGEVMTLLGRPHRFDGVAP